MDAGISVVDDTVNVFVPSPEARTRYSPSFPLSEFKRLTLFPAASPCGLAVLIVSTSVVALYVVLPTRISCPIFNTYCPALMLASPLVIATAT